MSREGDMSRGGKGETVNVYDRMRSDRRRKPVRVRPRVAVPVRLAGSAPWRIINPSRVLVALFAATLNRADSVCGE